MSPAGNAASPETVLAMYSYKVHKQKKQYMEDQFIIGDRK